MALTPKPYTFSDLRGYSNTVQAVLPGSTLDLRVSSGPDYSVTAVKPGPNVNQPSIFDALPWEIDGHTIGGQMMQPVTPGSYVDIVNHLTNIPSNGFSVECWVRPWISGYHGLVAQYNYPTQCGFGLFIDPSGFPWFYLGDGGAYNAGNYLLIADTSLFNLVPPDDPGPPVVHHYPYEYWYHIVGVYGGVATGTMSIYINGVLHGTRIRAGVAPAPGAADLLLASYGQNNFADNMLNGDLAMPVIWRKAFNAGEVISRFNDRGLTVPVDPTIDGVWQFGEERGSSVADSSASGRNGTIVNVATWMIGGPNFVGLPVGLGTPPYFPAKDWPDRLCAYNPFNPDDPNNINPNDSVPGRGHALRFASDDIYDCGWTTTDTIQVPDNALPGLYAALLTSTDDTQFPQYIPFIVRSNAETKPPLVVLCSRNTWRAYGTENDVDIFINPLPGAGGAYSMYTAHNAGMPAYQVGLRIPVPKAEPYFPYPDSTVNIQDYPHSPARSDRFLLIWLQQCSYDFDVIGDIDLHADSTIIDSSQTLIINGHSEYWSEQAYAVVQNHLNNGGQLIVMSGNTMFWRVSFDSDLTIMEGRKYPDWVTEWGGSSATHIGEAWHSQDWERGGLLRECGNPMWPLTGMECVGYDDESNYNVTNPTHSLFTEPINLGLSLGDPLGIAQGQNLNAGCVVHEYDVTIGSLPSPTTPTCGTDPGPATPDVLANCKSSGGEYVDYFMNQLSASDSILSEISYWERPAGGTIFSVGAIAAGQGLVFDPKMLMLMMNVLANFSISRKEVSASSSAFSSTQNNVIAIQNDGSMLNKWFDGTNWNPSETDWQSLGGQFQGMPCIVNNGTTITIVALGTDRHVHANQWSGSDWSGWEDIGGNFIISGDPSDPQPTDVILYPGMSVSPTMICFDFLYGIAGFVFCIDVNGEMNVKIWDGSSWSTIWYSLGGAFFTRPSVVFNPNNALGSVDLFALGNDGAIYLNSFVKYEHGAAWTDWQQLDSSFLGSPAAAWCDSFEAVAATGLDGCVHVITWDPDDGWTDDQNLGGDFDLSPAIIWSQSRLNIMLIGMDGHLYNKWSYDGSTWSDGWQDLGSAFRGVPSIEQSVPDQLEVFVVGTDNSIYHKLWNGSDWIPSTTGWDNFGGDVGL